MQVRTQMVFASTNPIRMAAKTHELESALTSIDHSPLHERASTLESMPLPRLCSSRLSCVRQKVDACRAQVAKRGGRLHLTRSFSHFYAPFSHLAYRLVRPIERRRLCT